MMHEKHIRLLGLPAKDYLDEKKIMKQYRNKLNKSPDEMISLSESALTLMKISGKDFTGQTITEEVFHYMIENSEVANGTLTMTIRGFRPLAQNGIIRVMKKKFGKHKGSFYDQDSCEIDLNSVQLPNDRTGSPYPFPPIKIAVSSTEEGIIFSIKGESATLFALFHMPLLIAQFMKQIPENIENCYSTPGAKIKQKSKEKSYSSSSSSSESSLSQCNPVNSDEAFDITPPSSLPSPVPGPFPPVGSVPGTPLQVSPLRRSTTPTSSPLARTLSSPQPPSSPPSPVFHTKRRERRVQLDGDPLHARNDPVSTADPINMCDDCTLIDIGLDMKILLSKHGMQVNQNCQERCLEYKDSTQFFIRELWQFCCKSKLLDIDSLDDFKTNMQIVVKLFENIPKGAPGFFCLILDFLGTIPQADQDRFVVILSQMMDYFLTDQFVAIFIQEKNARRNLHNYLSNTGSIFCFQEAVKILHRIYLIGGNLVKILPSWNKSSELFGPAPEVQNDDSYHCFIAHASRNILVDVFNKKSIDFFHVSKKMYNDTEDNLEVSGDSFLYLDKCNSVFHHFLLLDNEAFVDKISLNDFQSLKENVLSFSNWIFYLDSDVGVIEKLRIFTDGKGAMEESESIGDTGEKHGDYDDYVENTDTKMDNSKVRDDNDDCPGDGDSSDLHVIKTKITITTSKIMQYWDAKPRKRRKFVGGMVGADWPKMYGSPCAVVINKNNHVKVVGSQKRADNFSKVTGTCKICSAIHNYDIVDNPFEETLTTDHLVLYNPVRDMEIKVTVTGKFELDKDNEPIITKPKHYLKNSTGLHLKGRARELIANKATNIGAKSTYLEQLDYADEHQIKFGNRTSVKSVPVIKQARQEQEKKSQGGRNFYEAAVNVYESQVMDFSPNFEETANSRKFPGFIRSMQQHPFKLILANYDMMKIATAYLNNSKKSIIHIDSSGKFLKPKRGKKLLNTALVIPPPAPGHAPFPIMELISETNKAIDFKMFMDLGWSYLSSAIGDEPVAPPKYAVTDMSFANIHALMGSFNNTKLPEYLQTCFDAFMKNEKMNYPTTITVCENHITPAFLKTARTSGAEKTIADTFVAGFMLLLRAKTISDALAIWNDMVLIFGSKQESQEVRIAMDSLKDKSTPFSDDKETEDLHLHDFEDDCTKEEEVFYGNRRLLRENSPFQKLFKRPVDKQSNTQNDIVDISNQFYSPNLLAIMAKQYLSLFPLFSASVLEDGLVTNTYVELYWKEQRRLLKGVPDRIVWPPYYLGNLHTSIRREAKNFLLHNRIPSLKYGGKVKAGSEIRFSEYFDDSQRKTESNLFVPTPGKADKRKRKVDESYSGAQEEWNSQKKRTNKKPRYMKGKVLDFSAIGGSLDEQFRKRVSELSAPAEKPSKPITVTGTKKGLGKTAASVPQEIVLTNEDIHFISNEHLYLTTDAVDAGLSLLDRRLNEESELDVTIYSTQACRWFLFGDKEYLKNGTFITIIPRNFGIAEEELRINAFQAGGFANEPGGHFTLVSNLHCRPGEVNIYETFEPYRDQEALLTPNGKTLVKTLCNSENKNLKVNAVNVKLQDESECGAIAIALAVNLCFYAPSEEAVFRKIVKVREVLLDCLKNNHLNYFKMAPRQNISEHSKVLFSINI